MMPETISQIEQQISALHISLDNLRGDRKKLKDYRECDKQLRKLMNVRKNLEAAAQFHDGMLVGKANSEEVGIVFETVITPGGHAEVWVSWDGGVPVPEQPELLIIDDSQCSLLDIVLRDQEGIVGEQLQPDTNHYGQLNTTSTPQLSTESDSQKPDLSKQTLLPLVTNSLSPSPLQTCLSSEVLAQICPPQAFEQGLMDLAQNCFLRQSDFCDFKTLKVSYLRMCQDCSPVTTEVTLNRSSAPSLNWGMWGFGSPAMENNGFPKIDNESFLWVLSGNVRSQNINPNRPTLQQCLENNGVAIIHKSRGGDRIYTELAPTIRSCANTAGHQSGTGAWKVKEQDGTVRPLRPTECEHLMGWEVGSTEFGITEAGKEIKISNTQRHRMLGNGIIPAEMENICNNLRIFLEEMNSSSTNDRYQAQPGNEIESNYGMMEQIVPAQCLATDGGSESINNEDSAMDQYTIGGTVVAANFKIGDRVKSTSPIFFNKVCTITSLPSNDAAIVELEDGVRERLKIQHLEPINAPDYLAQVTESTKARFEIIEELSFDEEKERHRLELKVERAFYEAGCALRDLRDKRLYRSTHSTFEEYCQDRFGYTRRNANYTIAAAAVVDNLCPNLSQNGNGEDLGKILSQNGNGEDLGKIRTQILPTTAEQVRHLTKLQPEEQRTCWQAAVDLADGKVPTGKIVKGVVERLLEKPLNYASSYCEVGEIFRLQQLRDSYHKYNGWWGIALEVENRFTVKCQVYDTTIEIRQDNIKRIDMTTEETKKQQEIIERVSRLARCNLDPAVWALLEVLNSQNHHTDVQMKMLEFAEQLYKVQVSNN